MLKKTMYYSHSLHDRFQTTSKDAHHNGIEHFLLRGLKGVAIASAAISLSPFLFGISGEGAFAKDLTLSICGAGTATGLTATVSGVMAQIPLVGGYLATGGLINGVATLVIGLGGVAAARMLERHNKPTAAKIVRWASIATSILVSLPAILPALGMGFHFLSNVTDNEFLKDWTLSAYEALGKMGTASGITVAMNSGSALLASASHLIACGAAAGSAVWISQSAQKITPHAKIMTPIDTFDRLHLSTHTLAI